MRASYVLSLLIFLISIIYHRSILFKFFILLIFMFFVQVSYTIISFTWCIIRPTSLLISITFVAYLMTKRWRCFFRNIFFYTSKTFFLTLFLRLNGSWIGCFLLIEVSGVFLFCEEYEEYLVLYLLNNPLVKTNQKYPYCPWKYLFLWGLLFW